jgi:hypothetical protein
VEAPLRHCLPPFDVFLFSHNKIHDTPYKMYTLSLFSEKAWCSKKISKVEKNMKENDRVVKNN